MELQQSGQTLTGWCRKLLDAQVGWGGDGARLPAALRASRPASLSLLARRPIKPQLSPNRRPPWPNRPRPQPVSANPRVAGPCSSGRPAPLSLLQVGPGAEAMAPWALLTPGVLVRTGHTVLTWGDRWYSSCMVLADKDLSTRLLDPIRQFLGCFGLTESLGEPPRRSWDFPDSLPRQEPSPHLSFQEPPAFRLIPS